MRISQQQMVDASLQRLRERLGEYERVQSRLASGKQIRRPSEDPGTMNSIMSLRSSQRMRQQEARNAQEGLTWINLADSKLQNVTTAINRAHDLLVRSGSPLSDAERSAIAMEIEGLRKEIEALANARHQDQGLFAGFSASDAVVQSGTPPVWSYGGDGGVLERRIGEGETVTVSLTGDYVFSFDAGPGKDVFSVLYDAEQAVRAGDAAAINATMAEVERVGNRVLDATARLGAVGARIERVLERNTEEQVTLKSEMSEMEDVDLAEAVMELQLQEVAYNATLAALSRAMQPSLVDFLR